MSTSWLLEHLTPDGDHPFKLHARSGSAHVFRSPSGDEIEVVAMSLPVGGAARFKELDFWLMRSPHVGQAATASVKGRSPDREQRTLGYVFPVRALLDDSLHEAGSYQLVYAQYATYFLLHEVYRECAISADASSLVQGGAVSLDTLFIDELGVLVLGKSNLLECNLAAADVLLSLQAHFYSQIDNPPQPLRLPIETFRESVGIAPHRPELEQARDEILWLLAESLNQSSHVTRYLLLYQILEVLSQKVFTSEMLGVLKRAASGEVNSWEAANVVHEISNEKERLGKLVGRYSKDISFEQRLALIKGAKAFLNAIGRESRLPKTESWVEHVYAVRNEVVHGLRPETAPGLPHLSQLCDTLHPVCVHLAVNFNHSVTQPVME